MKNADRLGCLVRQYGGDVLAAVVELGGCTTNTELADKLGLPRATLEQCLRPYRGRSYRHVRRSIEAQLGLPQYALDEEVPEWP